MNIIARIYRIFQELERQADAGERLVAQLAEMDRTNAALWGAARKIRDEEMKAMADERAAREAYSLTPQEQKFERSTPPPPKNPDGRAGAAGPAFTPQGRAEKWLREAFGPSGSTSPRAGERDAQESAGQ